MVEPSNIRQQFKQSSKEEKTKQKQKRKQKMKQLLQRLDVKKEECVLESKKESTRS